MLAGLGRTLMRGEQRLRAFHSQIYPLFLTLGLRWGSQLFGFRTIADHSLNIHRSIVGCLAPNFTALRSAGSLPCILGVMCGQPSAQSVLCLSEVFDERNAGEKCAPAHLVRSFCRF